MKTWSPIVDIPFLCVEIDIPFYLQVEHSIEMYLINKTRNIGLVLGISLFTQQHLHRCHVGIYKALCIFRLNRSSDIKANTDNIHDVCWHQPTS